jgi:dTDP-4-dehydrorhamnose reductase
MKIALVGSTGQLGQDLLKALKAEHEVIPLTHQNIEVTDLDSVLALKQLKPDIVINTAAFHKTDACEDEPAKTFAVNAIGPKNIAAVSRQINATTIFISTDYVFSGTKHSPYTEKDIPEPINTYGISKVAGEFFTKRNPNHYIFRVASLFGAAGASGKGGNFIETMLAKARKNELITVVDDMRMSPTYTHDAAETIKRAISLKIPYGTYHVTNQGACTWFQFSQEIFRLTNLAPELRGMKTSDMPVKAERPLNSALVSVKLSKYGLVMRSWKEALKAYLIEKGHITPH